MATTRENLDRLLAAGRQMLADAQAGEWGRAGKLQDECRTGAEHLLQGEIAREDLDAVAVGVRELLILHEQTTQLCRDSRESCMAEIEEFSHGRKGVSAYVENSG